ncbi:MAG: hypothetical protein II844_00980 [Prevotella sp.]|nr:hypothetical protein [Prevotella sp.]
MRTNGLPYIIYGNINKSKQGWGERKNFIIFAKNNFSFSLFFFFEFLGLRGCMGVGGIYRYTHPHAHPYAYSSKTFWFPTPFSPPYDETKKAAGYPCGKNK